MRPPASLILFGATFLASGCAHHHARNQYAYAPPYAPAVYPQPASFSQPPAAAMPAAVAAAPPPAGAVGAPWPQPAAQAMQTTPCPAGEYIVGESVVSGEVPCTGGEVVVADGQTPACPPIP
jgi:hypothetical protein